MSINKKLIAKVNKMVPVNISILNDPVALASSCGMITDINEKFTEIFQWEKDEIVGQNVHLLIPSKFIRKTVHDKKMAQYRPGEPSTLVGKTRTVPLVTPDDKEILVTIQLIPVENKKEFCFIVLLNVIDFDRIIGDFCLEFDALKTQMKDLDKKEEFREDSAGTSLIVREISRIFAAELKTIVNFIVENSLSPRVGFMCKHFIVYSPIGKLGSLRKLMESVFNNNDISYLNVICLRIIFPAIVCKVDLGFVNSLKKALYECVEESSDS